MPASSGAMHLVPEPQQVLGGRDLGERLVAAGEERRIEFGVQPRADAEQRQHRVVNGDQVPEQVHEAVLARRDLHAELVVAEPGEEAAGAVDVQGPFAHGARDEGLLWSHMRCAGSYRRGAMRGNSVMRMFVQP